MIWPLREQKEKQTARLFCSVISEKFRLAKHHHHDSPIISKIFWVAQLHAESLYRPHYSNVFKRKLNNHYWRASCSTVHKVKAVVMVDVVVEEAKTNVKIAAAVKWVAVNAHPGAMKTKGRAVGLATPKAIHRRRVKAGKTPNMAKAAGSAIPKAIRKRRARDGAIPSMAKAAGSAIPKAIPALLARGGAKNTKATAGAEKAAARAQAIAAAGVAGMRKMTMKGIPVAGVAEAVKKKMTMTIPRIPVIPAAAEAEAKMKMEARAAGAGARKAANRSMKIAAGALAKAGASGINTLLTAA